jgi:murein DD-endopeptidase MepM/ murein hydrolase activator NlpD
MKVILLRESGKARVLRLTPARLGSCAAAALVLLLFPLLVAFRWVAADYDESLVSDWKRELSEQQTELKSLESVAAAESQAVGRQLAAMQARLLRMEALGARVAEVAALDDGEFDFASAPATGGPEVPSEELDGFELKDALADLSLDLQRREAELEVLEGLLRDRGYRDATAVAGKPVASGWISSWFGNRVDPFSGDSAFHSGLDFTAPRGTAVQAAAGGVVIFAGRMHEYGNAVEINHGDGYVTRYAHQDKLRVSVGQVVKRGQVIGAVGTSGRASGPHLHFEVLKNGQYVDPRRYIARAL